MPLYRLLLHLYPASFRNEYGDEMCAVFARRRRDAAGWPGAIALWIGVVFEVLGNAAAVHWDILRQDLRYTARALRRSAGFAATAVLVVALGIGANTAAFSLADQVLVRPLPFPQSDRLVKLWETVPGYARMQLSPANLRDWKAMQHSFESIGAYNENELNLADQGEPERLHIATVTSEVFPMLGIRPLLGHVFEPADDREGARPTVLLSYGLWQRRFAADPRILGRDVQLNGRASTVIGVMPRNFYFPRRDTQLWTALQLGAASYEDRADNWLVAISKLRPGVSLAQASADLAVVSAQLERQYPKENEKTGSTVLGLRDEVSSQSRMLLLALVGAAGCVLAIACLNLANLLLVRALARGRELAVRTALGAGRERLVRQLTTESLILAGIGGLLGVAAAALTLPLLSRLVPADLPVQQATVLDWRVLLFAGLLTAATGVFFGLAPAWRVSGRDGLAALREDSRTGSGSQEGLRSLLVMAEVTASIVLLVSTGLLMRALWKIQNQDPGFRTEGVLTMRTALPAPRYDQTELRAAFYNRVLGEVRKQPGVRDAAYISFLPMEIGGGGIWPVQVNEQVLSRTRAHTAIMRYVTPGFFATLRIPIRLGRDVAESDLPNRPNAAVVSQSFADRYWPGQNPLGRHFTMAYSDREVVGVVGDIRVRGLERISEPQVYFSYRQVEDGSFGFYAPKDLVVRSDGSLTPLVQAITRIVRAADAQQPVSNVRTLATMVEENTASRAVQVRVLGAFAAIAFLLAAVGIHGVLAFAVSSRTREIGIRMALGARRGDVVRMVLGRGVALAIAGVVPGVLLAYFAGRFLESLLAGVKPYDTATFLAAAGLCLATTLIGSLLPAWRAAHTDPMRAIRAE